MLDIPYGNQDIPFASSSNEYIATYDAATGAAFWGEDVSSSVFL